MQYFNFQFISESDDLFTVEEYICARRERSAPNYTTKHPMIHGPVLATSTIATKGTIGIAVLPTIAVLVVTLVLAAPDTANTGNRVI